MNKKTSYILIGLVVVIALLFGWYYSQPGKLDTFAQCLEEKGAVFYGAFWCPHCQEQKQMFGKSKDLLPYVECSAPDGKSQLQECIDADVKSYPTWDFADGERRTGVVELEDLAEKTECALPE